ncbi:MAG: hypothetical protein RIF32_18385 [Leptospirales bacterium]|jgi:hypothetical protein
MSASEKPGSQGAHSPGGPPSGPQTWKRSRFQKLLRQSPALFQKIVIGGIITLAVFILFFGVDLLDWIFLTSDGVSALTPLRRWMNESTGMKLILLLAWGWAVMDLALAGGEAMAAGPYERFARHLNQVPGHLTPFHLRQGDEYFRVVADAYNGVVVRLTRQEEQIEKYLHLAARKNYSAQRILRELHQFTGEQNESEIGME